MIQVSVVIPAYNRREKLGKAIESVRAQAGCAFEIIVVDDGSADGTAEMIAGSFPEVRYFYQANQGPAAARNHGIKKARGEWLSFLDSDDEWLKGKLAAQLEFAQNHPEFLIHQTGEIWIRDGRRVNPMKKHQKYGGFIFEKCLALCIVSPSAVMIHKRVFEAAGLFDETFPACEDYDLWLRIASKFPVGLLEKNYVVKYGGHADQRSHEFPAMDRFRIRSLSKLILSGMLNPAQHQAASKTLQEKLLIYTQGAQKRGHYDEAKELAETALAALALPLS